MRDDDTFFTVRGRGLGRVCVFNVGKLILILPLGDRFHANNSIPWDADETLISEFQIHFVLEN